MHTDIHTWEGGREGDRQGVGGGDFEHIATDAGI